MLDLQVFRVQIARRTPKKQLVLVSILFRRGA